MQKVTAPFTFPPVIFKSPSFSISLLTCIFWFFDYSHISGCESIMWFWFAFPWWQMMLNIFSVVYLSVELKSSLYTLDTVQFSSVQSLSGVQLFATPWTAACQASLSITNSRNSPKPMSIESVMPTNHLILCCPHLLLPSIFPSIRVFSNESAVRIRWPKDWSFSFSISPFSEHQGLISFRMDWLDLLVV